MNSETEIAKRAAMSRIVRAAEQMMDLPPIGSPARSEELRIARQILAVIGIDGLRMTSTSVAKVMRCSHSTVLRLLDEGRPRVGKEPFQTVYVELLAMYDEPTPVAGPAEKKATHPRGNPTANLAPAEAKADDVWLSRKWWDENNARFVAAMRAALPDETGGQS